MKKVILRKIKFDNSKHRKFFKKHWKGHTHELLLLDNDNNLQSRIHGKKSKLFIEAAAMRRLFIEGDNNPELVPEIRAEL